MCDVVRLFVITSYLLHISRETSKEYTSLCVKCLSQLRNATWDGNLISKDIRGELVQIGMAQRWNGWQV
jgi:hypothetical protein